MISDSLVLIPEMRGCGELMNKPLPTIETLLEVLPLIPTLSLMDSLSREVIGDNLTPEAQAEVHEIIRLIRAGKYTMSRAYFPDISLR